MGPAPHSLSLSTRPLVDQEQKKKLVLQKQIHQATSQMLRRPSHFTRAAHQDMSRPVLQALLTQKSQGRLTGSALECWVDRFEVYHLESSSGNVRDEDVEAQFQALNSEFEAEYASATFNSSVPAHTPLDCSAAKARVTRQKSFNKAMPAAKAAPSAKAPFQPPLASPRVRQYQPSNVARELKQKLEVVRGGEVGSHDFVLGQEPQGGVPKEHQGGIPKEGLPKEPDVKPSTASRFPFLQRVTNSLERRPKPKTEPKTYYGNRNNDKEKQPTPEPYYEEIAVMRKRKKKEPPTTPTPCTKDLYEEILLDDLYEQVPSGPITKDSRSRDEQSLKEESARPFERFQDFLFKTFTTLVPWCLMKRVYWKRDTRSEQRFEDHSRRGSQFRSHVSKDRKSLKR